MLSCLVLLFRGSLSLLVIKPVSTCLDSLVNHTSSYDSTCGAVKPMGFCRRQVHIGFAAPQGTKCRVSNSAAGVLCVCVRVSCAYVRLSLAKVIGCLLHPLFAHAKVRGLSPRHTPLGIM